MAPVYPSASHSPRVGVQVSTGSRSAGVNICLYLQAPSSVLVRPRLDANTNGAATGYAGSTPEGGPVGAGTRNGRPGRFPPYAPQPLRAMLHPGEVPLAGRNCESRPRGVGAGALSSSGKATTTMSHHACSIRRTPTRPHTYARTRWRGHTCTPNANSRVIGNGHHWRGRGPEGATRRLFPGSGGGGGEGVQPAKVADKTCNFRRRRRPGPCNRCPASPPLRDKIRTRPPPRGKQRAWHFSSEWRLTCRTHPGGHSTGALSI